MDKYEASDAFLQQRSAVRKASLYITALWARSLPVLLSSAEGALTLQTPSIRDGTVILPLQWLDENSASSRIRAATAHAAAHCVYGGAPYDSGDLRPRQKILVGLMEDARVEYLACLRFPGLRPLWRSWFLPDSLEEPGFPGLVRRLALSLLDPDYDDANVWVRKGVALFQSARDNMHNHAVSREIGIKLAHDLGQLRLPMDEGREFRINEYRDDNRHLWVEVEELQAGTASEQEEQTPQLQEGVFFRETGEGKVLELASHQGRQEVADAWYIRDDPQEAVLEYRRLQEEPATGVTRYPEWNYQIQLLRQNWCSLVEYTSHVDAEVDVVQMLRVLRPVLRRMLRVVRAIKLEKLQRVRRQKEGDELDLDAAIVALGELNAGLEPDSRVHIKARHLHDRGLASLLLLDTSESINDTVNRQGTRILDIAKQACMLLAETMDELGEPFAMQGFCSNTRKDVRCYNIKSFTQAMDHEVLSRIAAIPAQYSTRMGAAIRHAVAQLQRQEQHRKLLLLVTDGMPADIDVYDPVYLVKDARQAVLEARDTGILVYALCLDPQAGDTMSGIFGRGHFTLLDNLARLPESLASIFLRLVRAY